ncbi:glyoxalase/bleomycin resistance/dioxygenase family protein [Actinoplanes sp. ATCC 53533]|uniref:VOC family protein n=1 Tax=Actinoplanes sp. ATCC 53533 TaxID=1288362 RepID=UPI000F79F72F|nr:VOC family protein [Actinoplanes sp. ATCC 53533]RSM55629.1 glyoxalase/bleomycin resistance/dioxygenase family protein [Actinoplanes sp. ATCC 53533]
MHRSRLYGLFVDTPAPDAPAAAAFWSAALGVPAVPESHEEQFTMLRGAFPALAIGVQAVGDAPRYHVDIETDDHEAETTRLTGLGAVEINRWLDCHIMRAPGGHLLCVVPVHSEADLFAAQATVWP